MKLSEQIGTCADQTRLCGADYTALDELAQRARELEAHLEAYECLQKESHKQIRALEAKLAKIEKATADVLNQTDPEVVLSLPIDILVIIDGTKP